MADLLAAAAEEFAEAGYDAATMCSVAERAGAAIGSLYQFFPNKQALALALRMRYGKEYEQSTAPLQAQARRLTLEQFVARWVDLLVGFVDAHPAYLAMLDAPASTRAPSILRWHRQRLAALLRKHRPSLPAAKAARIAAVSMHINKACMAMYAQAPARDKAWVIEEFRTALTRYLGSRIGS